AGSLFLRSLERSDRVYSAMLARGYTGQQPAQDHAPLSGAERRVLLAGGLLLALFWTLSLLIGG
ncbi:MAG TPA: CbiQ family ECF transporter T component, partial [Anaerolineaceae bacterium]